jgi:NTP pyrophosphatase (non-canonical NTP hydrolase)
LIEVTGGLSLIASQKKKPKVDSQNFVAKALSWWMSLCGKVQINSVETLLWRKFPHVCPYCLKCPHDSDECNDIKNQTGSRLDWDKLTEIGKEGQNRPKSLGDWQRMFAEIYQPQAIADNRIIFARIIEELGEMAEALRVFHTEPGYFLTEAADVFAWIMALQNFVELKDEVPRKNRGMRLETAFCNMYPDQCIYCGSYPCNCPPIVESTIGRIAKETPLGEGAYGQYGIFMTPEMTDHRFNPAKRQHH